MTQLTDSTDSLMELFICNFLNLVFKKDMELDRILWILMELYVSWWNLIELDRT